ncbi:hypothetical protein [Pseudofrankia sp. DC12]|uniref:hypothetical protein n=1 Tax=Pseudofrankia sp. DC12 TaxID=683315 RepID=UPI0005F8413B|nr:hypothetical protein [Pseudofrankia sp. DC12]
MSDKSEAILAYWTEQRTQLRQSESQRSSMTNYVLVIAAGLSGLIAQQKYATTTIPLAALIVVVGLYGAITAAKFHERANYHLSQARALTKDLKDEGALPATTATPAYRVDHYAKYPRLSRLRLHWLWTGLHLAVAAYGCALVVIASV